MIESGDDAKQLCLTDARGAEKSDHLALGAIVAHDVANLCIDVAQHDLVVVGKTDVINLEKNIGVFIVSRQCSILNRARYLLSLLQLQVGIRTNELLGHAQRVILNEADDEDRAV